MEQTGTSQNEAAIADQSDADEAVVQTRLDAAPIVIVTRFSFLGESGWKSDASRSAEMLFEADRLNRRLELFCTITLPSLAAQTGMIGPLSTLLMGVVLLDEPFTLWTAAGTVLVLTGIYVFTRGGKR